MVLVFGCTVLHDIATSCIIFVHRMSEFHTENILYMYSSYQFVYFGPAQAMFVLCCYEFSLRNFSEIKSY